MVDVDVSVVTRAIEYADVLLETGTLGFIGKFAPYHSSDELPKFLQDTINRLIDEYHKESFIGAIDG